MPSDVQGDEHRRGHRDARCGLETVTRMVVDGSMTILCLDVFDTVLWRRVPVPADLFEVLGARLRADGLSVDWLTDHGFRRLREAAEHAARRGRGELGVEVSLPEIWAEMPAALFPGVPTDALVAAEVDVERAFTVADPAVAALARTAAKHGVPIALVSDTYFTADQLRRLLDRPELAALSDARLFRSNGHGTDKGSALWPVVLRALGVRPEEVVHVGDNPVADVEAPAALGVRTVHYERVDDAFAEVLGREHAAVDPREGDHGLTTLRARTVADVTTRAPRTAEPEDRAVGRAAIARRWGAGVLGPVLTGFAEWVATRAAERGVPVVWCPMREGELLAELVGTAARTRGLAVEARPLWLSRQVVWLAAVDGVDESSVRELVRRTYGATVGGLLGALGLRPDEVPSLAAALERPLDVPEVADEVAAALTAPGYVRHRVAALAAGHRERLLASLRAAGALDHPELVLVDLGWGGTIQMQLAEVLALAGVSVVPSGLYLATDGRSVRPLRRGLRLEGYLGSSGSPAPVVDTLARSPEVVELAVNAACGSLLAVDEDGGPVLGPVVDGPGQTVERAAVKEGVRAFAARWNLHAGADGSWPFLTDDAARARLGEILRAALDAPTEAESSLFGAWTHEDNLGSDLSSPLLPPHLVRSAPYLSVGDVTDLGMRDTFWPGLLAAADPHLGAALRAVRGGRVDAAVFETPSATSARLMYRGVDDAWHEGPRYPVRINHHGLSFARFGLHPVDPGRRPPTVVGRSDRAEHEILDVSVSPSGTAAVVRIDGLEVRARRADGEVHTLCWNTPSDLAGLHLVDATWLGGTVVDLRHDRSAVVLPVAARVGGPVVSVEVTATFALTPRSASGAPLDAAPGGARIAGRLLAEYRTRGAGGVVAGAARLAQRRLVRR